ncbi:MAG: T9SS type A sorting domain-containing protein [Saprospiraceae bacterium]
MKKALVFSCMIFFAQALFAQVNYNSVEISSQSEMNASGKEVIVQGDLLINGVDLENMDNLSTLVMVTGNLVIAQTALKNIQSLVNLNAIGGDLIIRGNHSLENLDGFQNLLHVGGDVIISNNKKLENVDGLNLLESLSGSLVVHKNQSLIDLEGLNNLKYVKGLLEITDNKMMSDCCTLASLVHFRKDNETIISGNLMTCSSKDQILESCTENLPAYQAEVGKQVQIATIDGQVSPNPTGGLFTISFETSYPQIIELSIFDLSGKSILNKVQNLDSGIHAFHLDGASWISGLYLIRIQTEEGVYNSRLIKE